MAKTYNVGRLSVEMVADTVQYVQKLKSAETTTKKSQGNIRGQMNKTSKTSKKTSKDVDGFGVSLKKLGEAATFINGPMGGVASRITSLNSLLGGAGGAVAVFGGLALGIGAVTTAAMASSIAHAKQYKEMKIFADVAGVAVREMQLLSGATKTVGVSTEKFGDIIKDVQDKIGDFVATGGGEFANVMTTLGDKLGYTATELQNMSGPDALEAVAHAMQAANVPMDQQIFLMESIANDASRLLPLYANLSEELNKQKDITDTLVRVMDEDQLQVYLDLEKATGRLIDNTQDLTADAMSPLAEKLTEVTNAFNFYLASLEKGSVAEARYERSKIRLRMDEIRESIDNASSATGRFVNVITGESTDVKVLRKELLKLSDDYDRVNNLINEGINPTGPVQLDNDANDASDKNQALLDDEEFITMVTHLRKLQKAEDARIKKNENAKKQAEAKARKARKDAHDKAIEDDSNFYANINALREAQIQKESDLFALESKSLSADTGDDQLNANNELALLKLNNERELELLRQQYAHKTELETQYQAAMKASKTQYYADVLAAHQSSVNAEIALYKGVAQGIADQASALAGATDEEKKQLTKQFLLKQTMAAADATLSYYATLAAHEAAAASLGVAGAPYLATQTALASANYAKNLAGIGAVTIGGLAAGQFHSGTDSVPSEGSYLLQKGERVVQPKANKDLTDFMASGGGGGKTEINAPINVTGNVTDEAWFSEQLVKQRKIIAASVAKVERERPSARRRK